MIKIIFYSQVHSLFSPGTETVVMTGRHIQSNWDRHINKV